MKIHSIVDCITNSSSTTFIVGFEKEPQTIGEMYDLLFPNGETAVQYYDNSISSFDAARVVFNDLQSAKKIENVDQLIREYMDGWFENRPYIDVYNCQEMLDLRNQFIKEYGNEADIREYPEWYNKKLDLLNQKWKEEEAMSARAADELAEEHWKIFKDLKTYIFEYSDEDGCFWSVMEHGPLFDNLYYKAVNKH